MLRFAGLIFVLVIGVIGTSCSSEDSATADAAAAADQTTAVASTITAGSTTVATSTPEQAEIEQLISDYLTAIGVADESFNRDDFLALVEESFKVTEHRYYASGSEVRYTGDHVVPAAELYLGSGWQLEHVSEPVIAGTGPWIASVVETLTRDSDHYVGTGTYVVVEVDGVLMIADKYWIGRIGTTDE